MPVTVRIPAAVQRYTGGVRAFVVEAATAGEALAAVFARHPDLRTRVVDDDGRLRSHLVLFLDETRLTGADPLAARIPQDAALHLHSAASGG